MNLQPKYSTRNSKIKQISRIGGKSPPLESLALDSGVIHIILPFIHAHKAAEISSHGGKNRSFMLQVAFYVRFPSASTGIWRQYY